MSWTYNAADLASNTKDQVRFLIGDVVSTSPQLQDEEIAFCLTQRLGIYGAAAMACQSLSTKLSREADAVQGDLRTLYSAKARAYAARAAQLESLAAGAGVLPYAGGISITDKQQREQDTDRVPPQFDIGMNDNLDYPVGEVGPQTLDPSIETGV